MKSSAWLYPLNMKQGFPNLEIQTEYVCAFFFIRHKYRRYLKRVELSCFAYIQKNVLLPSFGPTENAAVILKAEGTWRLHLQGRYSNDGAIKYLLNFCNAAHFTRNKNHMTESISRFDHREKLKSSVIPPIQVLLKSCNKLPSATFQFILDSHLYHLVIRGVSGQ